MLFDLIFLVTDWLLQHFVQQAKVWPVSGDASAQGPMIVQQVFCLRGETQKQCAAQIPIGISMT